MRLHWVLDHLSSQWPFGDLGRRGEKVAALYLRKQGLDVIARNLRVASGEVDLVARDGPTIVFVEVKSRTVSHDDQRTGLEKVDRHKRATLRRVCNSCRKRLPARYDSYRVDGVTVEFQRRGVGRRVGQVRWYPAILDLDE